MFSLFSKKKSLVKSNFFTDFIDFHSHILPAVDDGVRSVDASLRLLAEYETMGVKKIIFTPHVMEAFENNDAESLRSTFAKFKELYTGKIDINLAAEYMLDNYFDRHLESGDMLTLWDNYLLVETSYVSPPMNLSGLLENIRSKGYFVVLAHPERYVYMDKSDLIDLKKDGVLFQLNLLSLSGYYGKEIKERALYLLNNNMYDIIGSDIHRLESFKTWVEKIKLKPKQLDILSNIKNNYL